jgi:PAS domain S-box-containing protein
MKTHMTSSPDEVLAATAEGGPEESLDSLLRQIVGGYFVLTDGQGAVSKWSEPAELLFGRAGAEILGRPFFETLVGAPFPAAADKWRSFLETAEPPQVPGRVEVEGLRAEGERFPVEAVFVPVKLDEGFDFSLFLEDLGFELPLNLMLLRMRQQHPVVVRALRQALEDEPQPWDGWRTAGTLVIFRPLAPTPWVEQELAARDAKRAEVDAEVEERLTNPDPGIQGSSVQDLDDAAAVVARLLSAMERIDDLERLASGLPAQVDQARKEAEARAEIAEAEAKSLREDLRTAVDELKGAGDPERLELLARLDRLERARHDADSERAEREGALKAAEAARAELAERLDRLEAARAEAATEADARLAAAVEEARERAQEALEQAGRKADSARSAFESRIVELEKLRSGDAEKGQTELAAQLEQVRVEHEEAVQAARHELAETIERLERDREREAESARAELAAALERVEHVQRESDALREQLTSVTVERHEAEGLSGDDRRRLDELQRDAEQSRARIEALREQADELRGQADELRAEAAQAREDAAEVRAEIGGIQASALGDLERMKGAQDEMRALIESAQRDRDHFKAKTDAALSQLDDIRRQVEEHESSVSIKLPSQALERAEFTAVVGEARGEIEALTRAESALRAELETLTAAGDAVTQRVDALGTDVAGARDDAAAAREEAGAVRDEARQAGDAARELAARVDEIDRGAGSVLADVRAVRERLDEVSEETRAAVARVGGELEAAKGQLDRAAEEALGAREQAAAAAEAATAARDDAGRAREESAAMKRELETGRDRLTALGGQVQRLGESLLTATHAAESAQTEATAARRSNKELTDLVAELDSRATVLRSELGAGKERLQAVDRALAGLGTEVEDVRTAASGAAKEAKAAGAAVEEQGKALRAELAEVRALAEGAAGGIDSIRDDVEAVRGQAETMTREAKEARDIVRAGQKRLEAMAAEVTFALSSLDDVKAGLTSAGQAAVIARREAEQAKKAAQSAGDGSGVHSVNEVFAQLLGLAQQRGGQQRRTPSSPHHKKPDPIKREPRHGFDDVSQPMALLGLDGKFRELNPAFAKLVGYQEHEFAKATWPSPHDRSVYQQQQEELTKLASGEIESVIVQSTYMHGQGLMVPVIGRLSVAPGEDGLPLHLLLEAEDRHSNQ